MKLPKITILLLLLSSPFLKLQAQTFNDIQPNLLNMYEGAAAWGDYDNDSDLDICFTGKYGNIRICKVYRNDAGSFVDIPNGMFALSNGSMEWGDYDNDGDLDLVMTGTDGIDLHTIIYRNDAGIFIDILADLIGTSYGSVDWGDYDNDGDLDLLLTGTKGGILGVAVCTRIYRNDSGTFNDAGASLENVVNSCGAWGDYDSDGDLDILLTGKAVTGYISRIYRNDSGTFTDIQAGLKPIYQSGVAWGDYDNDGDLDFIMGGRDSSANAAVTIIYRNDAGLFTDINAGLSKSYDAHFAWGDCDNDGDLDLLTEGAFINTEVYRNDGGIFTVINSPLDHNSNSSIAWGDYDNDGDLDILLTGRHGTLSVSYIYRNTTAAPNLPPSPPTNLAVIALGNNELKFTWNSATDDSTSTLGLAYRLWVGTANDSFNVCAPMADTLTGWRKIAAIGEIQDTTWTLRYTMAGTYYACVSAIDAGLMGSPCSNKVSITAVVSREDGEIETILAGPNPTSGPIKVSRGIPSPSETTYNLMNLAGQSITGMAGVFKGELDLDLTMLPQGIYLLHLDSPDFQNHETIRIVKQ